MTTRGPQAVRDWATQAGRALLVGWRPDTVNLVRMTTAAVLAYVITRAVTVGPIDLTCSLTAILVTQASATGSLRMGMVRVGAVLTGIGVALVVSIWVGLTWWSLAVVVFASLLLGSLFRLGPQALETPISGMLILGASLQNTAAETRVLTTLIGAGVGIALPLLWPPAIPVGRAASSVRDVARRLAEVFSSSATAIDEAPVTAGSVAEHLRAARDVEDDLGRAGELVGQVGEMWQWNTRTIGRADVSPLLRSGLDSLQDCAAATRALFVALGHEVPDERGAGPQEFSDEVRAAVAVVLRDVGSCIDSFGQLVEAEVSGDPEQRQALLDDSVELLRETRAILTELMLMESSRDDGSDQWLLRGSILRAVDRILQVLDAQARAAAHARWRTEQGARPLPGPTMSQEFAPLDRAVLASLRRARGRPRRPGPRGTGPTRRP
ncbi:FUSC family protein [Serinicoccus kebangsaanensis]|uniref:FUSC family protein n=1 Tax=Serinicoccus kebangsaanensis TaxID=2602069 RepID=UPI00124C2F41|nr:FUSC family protein [Serinicoccus kebangsaanensis]